MPRLKGIQHVRLFAFPPEWEEVVEFYGDTLGLKLRARDDARGVAVFALGKADTLSVERANRKDPEEKRLVGRFVGVSIAVDDIRRAYRDLTAAGVRFDAAPQSQAWGGTLTHFRDPADNVLTLLQASSK